MKKFLATLLWYITDISYSISDFWLTLCYQHNLDEDDPL